MSMEKSVPLKRTKSLEMALVMGAAALSIGMDYRNGEPLTPRERVYGSEDRSQTPYVYRGRVKHGNGKLSKQRKHKGSKAAKRASRKKK